MIHLQAVFNLTFSELVLTCIIFALVMAARRVGKLGAAIGRALAGGSGSPDESAADAQDD